MLKSKFMAASTLVALGLLSSQAAWASLVGPGEPVINGPAPQLPGPAVVGLIVAAVIGAIVLSRSRK